MYQCGSLFVLSHCYNHLLDSNLGNLRDLSLYTGNWMGTSLELLYIISNSFYLKPGKKKSTRAHIRLTVNILKVIPSTRAIIMRNSYSTLPTYIVSRSFYRNLSSRVNRAVVAFCLYSRGT